MTLTGISSGKMMTTMTHTMSDLLLVTLVRELHVDVVVLADLGDDSSLAANDLRMVFRVNGQGQLEATQRLGRGTELISYVCYKLRETGNT